jgi:hypothetical protein
MLAQRFEDGPFENVKPTRQPGAIDTMKIVLSLTNDLSGDIMFHNPFSPNSEVPEDGAFWVHHYQHREAHVVQISRGEQFPPCQKCGERVRYERAIHNPLANHISFDIDFTSGLR